MASKARTPYTHPRRCKLCQYEETHGVNVNSEIVGTGVVVILIVIVMLNMTVILSMVPVELITTPS